MHEDFSESLSYIERVDAYKTPTILPCFNEITLR